MKEKNMFLNSFKAKTGIIILIVLTLFPNIFNSFKMLKTFPAFMMIDSVTANEARFVELKKYLSKTKKVGYITDIDSKNIFLTAETSLKDEKANSNAINNMAQLILTQYSLCPVFVYNQTDLPLVVGNFPNGLPKPDFFIKKYLTPVKTFPNGIILLKSEVK